MEKMGEIITFLVEVEEDEKHLKNAAVQAMESSPEASGTISCVFLKKKSQHAVTFLSKDTWAFANVCQMLQHA